MKITPDFSKIELKGLATEKQKELILKLGFEPSPGLTKQQASNEITIELARQKKKGEPRTQWHYHETGVNNLIAENEEIPF